MFIEYEGDKPESWVENVVYIRNADGTITELREDEEDAPDD